MEVCVEKRGLEPACSWSWTFYCMVYPTGVVSDFHISDMQSSLNGGDWAGDLHVHLE